MMKTKMINASLIAGLFMMCIFAPTGLGQSTGPPDCDSVVAPEPPDNIEGIVRGFPNKKNCIEVKLSPNPIISSSVIEFELSETSMVEICIYDHQGLKVMDVVKQEFGAGTNKVTFTPADLNSGTYYLCVFTGNQRGMRRCVII